MPLIANRYDLVQKLGQGGYGEVYEALDKHQQVTVALKLLKSPSASGPWIEAQMLEQLRGDFILPVRNADEDAGIHFIATDLATRGTLADRAAEGPFTHIAVRWARQTATAVQRCHDHGLLHRDLKPDNVFLDGNERALLGDFGLAWAMSRGTAPGAGTPRYLPPDVAAGGPMATASDIYGLGTILYELLSGRPPHIRLPPMWQLAVKHVGRTPPPPLRDVAPHVPLALGAVLRVAVPVRQLLTCPRLCPPRTVLRRSHPTSQGSGRRSARRDHRSHRHAAQVCQVLRLHVVGQQPRMATRF